MRIEYLVDEYGCRIWQMCRNKRGYGLTWDRATRRLMMAHRWYTSAPTDRFPTGMQIDHLCTNRACYRPDHLEAISRLENIRDAAWRDTCKRGHAMTPGSTSWQSGRRTCRACHVEACARSRQRTREARQRQRESAGPARAAPG